MKVIQKNIRTVDYILLNLNSLKVDDTIAFDIYIKKSKDYVVIIEAGTTLSQELYDKLENQENLYIRNEDKKNLTLTYRSLNTYIKHNKDNLEKRIELIYKLNTTLFENYFKNEDNYMDMECMNSIIKSLIFLVKYDRQIIKNTMPYFMDIHSLANHSLHVAIYALHIGNQLRLSDKELLKLGKASLLQDIGLKMIDDSLINKSTKLSEKEILKFQNHVRYSVDIAKKNHISDPYIINAIMHHHENQDGSGYPDKKRDENIGIFASILSICDVFDALTSNRPYRKNYSSFDAIKMMLKDESMAHKFNHTYLKILLQSL